LASRTDGVLLVLRAGANTHGVAQKARNTLTEAGGHILGAVLNGVRVMAGGYLRKNYDTFYEYRERQAILPPAFPPDH
jgi:Mrp family chromosome partitioning ATPase